MKSPLSVLCALLLVCVSLLFWWGRPEAVSNYQRLALSKVKSVERLASDTLRLKVLGQGIDAQTRFSLYRDFGNRRLLRSRLSLAGSVRDIAGRGDYLYLAGDKDGLVVCNVSDPARPFVVSSLSLSDRAWKLELVGDLVFVLSVKSTLHVIDVSDPDNPSLSQTLRLPGYLEDLIVHNDILYVSARERGIHLVDISDRQAPVFVTTVEAPGKARGLALRGDQLLVAGNRQGLQAFNIRASGLLEATGDYDVPGAVAEVFPLQDGQSLVSSTRGLFLVRHDGQVKAMTWQGEEINIVTSLLEHDGRLFVGTSVGVYLFQRKATDELELHGFIANDSQVEGLVRVGGNVYWGDSSTGLQGVAEDVRFSDTSALSLLKDTSLHQFKVSGRHIFAINTDYGMQSFERLSAGEYRVLDRLHEKWRVSSLAYSQGRFYLGLTGRRLFVLEIDQDGLLVKGNLALPGRAVDMATINDLLVVADDTAGLLCFSLAEPDRPFPVSALPSHGRAKSLAVDGDRIYLADGHGGLLVAQLSPAGGLKEINHRTFTHGVVDVTASGGAVVVLLENGKLLLLNGTTDARKSRSLLLDERVVTITSHAGYLYAKIVSGDVLVISLEGPAEQAGRIVNRLDLGVKYGSLRVEDDMILVSGGENGGRIYSLADPAAPTFVERFETPRVVNDFILEGRYALTVDNRSSLSLVPLKGAPNKQNDLLGDRGTALDLNGNLALFGSIDRLQVIDIALPENLQVVGSIRLSGMIEHIRSRGGRAFIANRQVGLQIVDISDYRTPRLLGTLKVPGGLKKLSVQDDLVVAIADKGKLVSIDVSDMSRPVLRKIWTMPNPLSDFSWFEDIESTEDRVYVADVRTGLYVFTVDAAGDIELLDHLMETGGVSDMQLDGERLYLSNKNQGIYVYDLSGDKSPERICEIEELQDVDKFWVDDSELVVFARSRAFFTLPTPQENFQLFQSEDQWLVDFHQPTKAGYYTLYATGARGDDKQAGIIYIDEQGAASLYQ